VNSTTASNTNSSTSSSALSSISPDHGHSKGLKIGIGIGVTCAVSALAAFCFTLLIWRRRKLSAKTLANANNFQKAELDGSEGAPKSELDGNGVVTGDEKRLTHELHSPLTIHEINSESNPPPQELQGSVPEPQELDGRTKTDREVT
jgi:hypothetical protein